MRPGCCGWVLQLVLMPASARAVLEVACCSVVRAAAECDQERLSALVLAAVSMSIALSVGGARRRSRASPGA